MYDSSDRDGLFTVTYADGTTGNWTQAELVNALRQSDAEREELGIPRSATTQPTR